MYFGTILGPFGMSSYQIRRFMHCVGRLLRLPYTDPELWHVELANRSSITAYRARLLACLVIKSVASWTVLADCFDYRIQSLTSGMSNYQTGRFMQCVGRLLRLQHTELDFWHA